jgi:PHD/YefM family antitoxin component YafN of YafNO toxin-antitoxin module
MALILFLPKSSLYYLGEKELSKQKVIISNEILDEKPFSLDISNMTIFVKGINSATVENADINLMLFYNSIDIKNIKIASVASAYIPTNISNVKLSYTIFNPLVVKGNSNGEFGKIKAKYEILNKKLTIYLKPSKKMFRKYSRSLRYFKKDANGEYVYAKTF